MTSFLGPVLLKKDVYFKVDLLRESGKTFQTRRVSGYQLMDDGDDDERKILYDSIDNFDGYNKTLPLLFEATVSFYKTPTEADIGDLASTKLLSNSQPLPKLHLNETYDLKQVKDLIKTGEIKRGKFYKLALNLANALSLPDMLIDIRIPKDQTRNNSGITQYLVSVPKELAVSTKIILPYISDGMTQVLACADPMDNIFENWPGKLTVWNYGIWFHNNGIKTIEEEDSGANEELIEDKKWFIIEYSVSGAEGGMVQGVNQIYDYPSGRLLSNSSFSALMKP